MLRFTQGNPLTILVTVGEALRAGIDSKERLDDFVAGLRGGEANFEDEEAEGRTKSLGASLSYGFASAFTDEERKRLALLHLFQGFVDVDALRAMGDSRGRVGARGSARPDARTGHRFARSRRRNRASDLRMAGAITACIRRCPGIFATCSRATLPAKRPSAPVALLSKRWVNWRTITTTNTGTEIVEVLRALMAEEDNLLAAWRLARQYGWWGRVISAMQGLRSYTRRPDAVPPGGGWSRPSRRILSIPHTDRPLPGREDEWSVVTEYRVRLAREERDLDKAERLQRLCVDWDRERAACGAGDGARAAQRSISATPSARSQSSVHELGQIQRENNDPSCAESYREAFGLYRIHRRQGRAGDLRL